MKGEFQERSSASADRDRVFILCEKLKPILMNEIKNSTSQIFILKESIGKRPLVLNRRYQAT